MITKVAVAQMLSGEVFEDNLSQARELITNAAEEGAQLVVLPENFALLDSKALITLAAKEVESQAIHKLLSTAAKAHKIWVIAGSLPVLTPDHKRVYAQCAVYNANGEKVAAYNKIHLFDVDVDDQHGAYRESAFIAPGNELVVADTPFGKIGLSICYDVRFPEQYQKLRELGAELIVVPAAFTYSTGEAHWEILLRARAIETQCYVLAPNQGGQHTPNRASWGHSMIIDPWGVIVAEREEMGGGVIYATINLDEVHNRRKAMPVSQHKQKAGF